MWLKRWFWSSNAKDIGVLYIIFALFSGIVGTSLSVLIRIELAGPDIQFIANNQLYNSIITAHAIVMIFFMVMPGLIGGFGNFLLPIVLKEPYMVFPKLNNISYILLPISLILFFFALYIEYWVGTGWTLYPILSSIQSHSGLSVVLAILSLHLSGVSSLLGAMNFIIMIFKNWTHIRLDKVTLLGWTIILMGVILSSNELALIGIIINVYNKFFAYLDIVQNNYKEKCIDISIADKLMKMHPFIYHICVPWLILILFKVMLLSYLGWIVYWLYVFDLEFGHDIYRFYYYSKYNICNALGIKYTINIKDVQSRFMIWRIIGFLYIKGFIKTEEYFNKILYETKKKNFFNYLYFILFQLSLFIFWFFISESVDIISIIIALGNISLVNYIIKHKKPTLTGLMSAVTIIFIFNWLGISPLMFFLKHTYNNILTIFSLSSDIIELFFINISDLSIWCCNNIVLSLNSYISIPYEGGINIIIDYFEFFKLSIKRNLIEIIKIPGKIFTNVELTKSIALGIKQSIILISNTVIVSASYKVLMNPNFPYIGYTGGVGMSGNTGSNMPGGPSGGNEGIIGNIQTSQNEDSENITQSNINFWNLYRGSWENSHLVQNSYNPGYQSNIVQSTYGNMPSNPWMTTGNTAQSNYNPINSNLGYIMPIPSDTNTLISSGNNPINSNLGYIMPTPSDTNTLMSSGNNPINSNLGYNDTNKYIAMNSYKLQSLLFPKIFHEDIDLTVNTLTQYSNYMTTLYNRGLTWLVKLNQQENIIKSKANCYIFDEDKTAFVHTGILPKRYFDCVVSFQGVIHNNVEYRDSLVHIPLHLNLVNKFDYIPSEPDTEIHKLDWGLRITVKHGNPVKRHNSIYINGTVDNMFTYNFENPQCFSNKFNIYCIKLGLEYMKQYFLEQKVPFSLHNKLFDPRVEIFILQFLSQKHPKLFSKLLEIQQDNNTSTSYIHSIRWNKIKSKDLIEVLRPECSEIRGNGRLSDIPVLNLNEHIPIVLPNRSCNLDGSKLSFYEIYYIQRSNSRIVNKLSINKEIITSSTSTDIIRYPVHTPFSNTSLFNRNNLSSNTINNRSNISRNLGIQYENTTLMEHILELGDSAKKRGGSEISDRTENSNNEISNRRLKKKGRTEIVPNS